MIIPTTYAQINFIGGGTAYPRGWEVAIGVTNTGDLSAPAIAAAASTAWNTNICPVQSNQCTTYGILAKRGPNATGIAYRLEVNLNGNLGTQALPAQVGVLVTKLTDQGGRHGRGRMFMPGATESQTDGGGTLNAAALTAWQGAMDAFKAALNTAGIPMQLLHATALPVPYPVTSLSVANLMASQRRRIRRVGGRRTS